MSQFRFLFSLFTMMVFSLLSCESNEPVTEEVTIEPENTDRPTVKYDQEINWLTWEEAFQKSQSDKKKVFVDLYTCLLYTSPSPRD